jgi:hypothetical protein
MMEKQTSISVPAQAIFAFSTAAAVTAAAVAVTLQFSLRRKQAAQPQDILMRCKESIKSIEREIEGLG